LLRTMWRRFYLRAVAAALIAGALLLVAGTAFGRLLPLNDQLAYMSNRRNPATAGNWDIMLRDLGRNLTVALTHHPTEDRYPAWSPDGSQLAFHSRREGFYSIYILNTDNGDLRKLPAYNPAEEGFVNSWGVAMAAWSPDGQSIAYHADFDSNGPWNLFIVDLAGNTLQRLSESLFDQVLLSWSPDGTRVAYSGEIAGTDGLEIFVRDFANGTARQITGEDERDIPPRSGAPGYNTSTGSWHPEWSPDGRQIVFASSRDGLDAIYVVNPDGTGLRQLTNDFYEYQNPTWSSDGQYILFTSNRAGLPQIFAMRPDGTDVRQLTFGPPSDAAAWRPQG
jgi:TolB protein